MVKSFPHCGEIVRLPLKTRQLARTLERLVHAQHHAARFDDGVSRFAFFELESGCRLIGDRGSDNLSADIDLENRFYLATPQAMRAPPPPKGAGWSE